MTVLARCKRHGVVVRCNGTDDHAASCDPSVLHCPRCGRRVTELEPEPDWAAAFASNEKGQQT